MTLRADQLRMVGWEAYRVQSYQNWCGHTQEVIPFPLADGSVRYVRVVGDAH
jgi:hypothetical protein